MKKQVHLKEKHFRILKFINEYDRLPTKLIAYLAGFDELKRCQEVLKTLVECDPPFLKRVAFSPLGASAGKPTYVYLLDHKGARVLSRELGYKVNSPKSPSVSTFQLEHTLEVNGFRISLEKACKAHPGVRLVDCIPEYRGKVGDRRVPIRVTQATVKFKHKYAKPVTFIPDLVFALEKDDKKALYFVEIDLDSENPKRLDDKIQAYDEYFESKGYERYSRQYDYEFKGFRLLLVGSLKRFDSILRNLYEINIDLKFVWMCESRELMEETFFSNIWVSGDRSTLERLALVRSS
jgi:hypothetical protein